MKTFTETKSLNELSNMIMLYQVNKLKKSLCQNTAGIVIEIKDHKKYWNHKNDELDDILISNSHELLGVAKLFS